MPPIQHSNGGHRHLALTPDLEGVIPSKINKYKSDFSWTDSKAIPLNKNLTLLNMDFHIYLISS